MPSAESCHRRAAATGALIAALCAGCATTQQTAARLQLNDDRLRAAGLPVHLAPSDRSGQVVVEAVRLLGSGAATVAVVTLRNRTHRTVADLPILVGIAHGASRRVLNATASTYFANHLPSIGAGATLRWVATVGGTVPRGARPFAQVGGTPAVAVGRAPLPDLAVTLTGRGATLRAQVINRSGVPQYQLPVYSILSAHGTVVGAAGASISTLDPGSRQTVQIRLVPGAGIPSGASVRVEAPATVLR